MKTIAITIEEDVLDRIDKLAASNRSGFIREAVRDYLARMDRQTEAEREREIFKRHGKRLHREALALIKEQAKP